MTRKRFIKLLMSRGYSRNEATTMALIAVGCGYTYDVAYFAVLLKDGEFEEVVREICNSIAAVLGVPLSLLFATTE